MIVVMYNSENPVTLGDLVVFRTTMWTTAGINEYMDVVKGGWL